MSETQSNLTHVCCQTAKHNYIQLCSTALVEIDMLFKQRTAGSENAGLTNDRHAVDIERTTLIFQ